MLSMLRQFLRHLKVSRMILLGLCLAVLGILSLTPTHAAINKQVNFQGRLTDANGNVVADGTYNVEFKLYTSSSADAGQGTCTGTCVWRETRLVSGSQGVTVSRGLFSVQLGEVTTLGSLNFNQDLYLSVRIGGTPSSPSWDTEMSPRHRLGAAPTAIYAETAGNATTAGGFTPGNASGNIPVSNGTVNTNLNADLLDGQSGSYYNDAANLTGTVVDARLSSNVALLNAANTFSASQIINVAGATALQLSNTTAGTGLTIGGDTNLYRNTGGNFLRSDDRFASASYIEANYGGGNLVTLGYNGTGAAPGLTFGSSYDTNLYRGAANLLQTDDNLLVKTTTNSATALQVQNSSGNSAFAVDNSNTYANLVIGGTGYTGGSNLTFNDNGANKFNFEVNDSGPAGTDGFNLYNWTDSAYVFGIGNHGAATFKNSANSQTAFNIQNTTGNALLTADTETTTDAQKIQIGDSGTSNPAVLLTLDSNASDPTGATNGAMYYNTVSGKNRCYQSGAWADCGGSGGGSSASYVHAYVNAAQNVPNNGGIVSFDAEDADTNGYHSTVSNTSRLTAPTAGYYQINATVSTALNTAGGRVMSFLKNGTTVYYGSTTDAVAGCFCSSVVSSSIGIELAAGDYIEVNAYQNSGGALALTTGVGNTHVSMSKAQGGVSDTLQQAFDAGNTINAAAGKGLNLLASAPPTTELLTISNSGQGTTTNNTENVQITSEGGSGAIEGGGLKIDFKPGGTSGATWNGLKITADATGAASGVAQNGIKLEGPSSPGSGTETAVNVTSGWDIGLAIGSGGMEITNMADPTTPAAGKLRVYTKTINGRSMLKAKGPSGVDYAYQPAFFAQAITMVTPLTGATVQSFGSTWTVDTTASTPAATQQYGLSTNFATAATANDTAGVSENIVQHFRGTVANQSNGYFYVGRFSFPDANYGSGATGARAWIGMTDQTAATTMTNADNPAGNYNGFQYSTNRGDTNWQFMTKNGTTQNVINTNMAFTIGKVYDFYVYTAPQGGTVYWRIQNITDDTNQEGSTTVNLPTATAGMRAGGVLRTLTTTARNFRMMKQYVESDQ